MMAMIESEDQSGGYSREYCMEMTQGTIRELAQKHQYTIRSQVASDFYLHFAENSYNVY